jgi:hypothetical protein
VSDDRPSDGRWVVTSTRATAAAAPMAVERIFRWMDIIVVMVVVEVEVESGSCVIIMMYSYEWWILILDFGLRILDLFGSGFGYNTERSV